MNALTKTPSYFDHNAAKGTPAAKPLGDVVEPDFDDTVSMRCGVLVQEDSLRFTRKEVAAAFGVPEQALRRQEVRLPATYPGPVACHVCDFQVEEGCPRRECPHKVRSGPYSLPGWLAKQ